ncbi:hypothetical protein [Xanthobacter flavus]|uniref:hypothetical protein n=1 Tax=Xanthobacter flavus TaxID=281 RepID=UPI00372642FF
MDAAEARARLSALSDLETKLSELGLHWNGVVREAIDDVRNRTIADAGDAVAHICMPCCGPIMVGDKMQFTTDAEPLCEACAFSWGDMREQWAQTAQAPASEEEAAEAAASLAAYVAHIDAGGSPDDKPLILAEVMR